jgi:uncharacterized Zn-binding protein involved in type VI secretion
MPGLPAARVGDMTIHGGTISPPGCPTVLIGGMPAARAGDMQICPLQDPVPPPPAVKPHVGGPIAKGSATVMIGKMPAARVGDTCTCASPMPNAIAPPGCPTVLIGG